MPTNLRQAICLTLFITQIVDAATVTVTNLPAYVNQRVCAKDCFYTGASIQGGPDRLARQLECPIDPIENDCFCRPDLQDDADALLVSCVASACSRNTVDVNIAVSIYDSYCTAAGFNREVESITTKSSSGTSPTSSRPSQTGQDVGSVTTGPNSAATSTVPADSASAGSLGTGELIGIIVGVLGFLATSVGVWFSYRMLKGRRATHAASQQTYVAQQMMAPSMYSNNHYGYR